VKGVDGLPWTTVLSSGQYFILRQGGTEPPNSSPLLNEKRRGVYVCAGCASPLFDSTQKFDSGTGWPSYASPRRAATETLSSFAGLLGGEVRCVSCGGHLGDVFRDGQKFPGTPAAVSGLRYCIDGAALVFIPSDADAGPIAGDGLTNLRTARLLPQPKRSSAITMQVAPDDISSVPALASRVAAMLAAAMIFAQAPLLSSLPSALSQACTEGTKAEINGDLELSPCLLLRWRVVTSRLFPPLLLEQSLQPLEWGVQSTGSSVWAGGIALSRYLEEHPQLVQDKRVVELGAGGGLASITAARLNAESALATDGDDSVLRLAQANAAHNLHGSPLSAFSTARLRWGASPLPQAAQGCDLVLGADVTYSRDAWPALAQTLRSLDAPALLAVSERRPNELAALREFLAEVRLRTSEPIASPLRVGYGAENIRLLMVERGEGVCESWVDDRDYAVEPRLVVSCK